MIIDYTFDEVKNYLPAKKTRSNKYDSGELLLIGGDVDYPGAIILASQMAIKSGAGLVYLYTCSKNVIKVLEKHPEIIAFDSKDRLLEIISRDITVLAGPGTKDNDWTKETFDLIKNKPLTIILDAAFMKKIKLQNSFINRILLPHEGEAARLLNINSSEIKKDRIKSIKKIYSSYNSTVVLKGYNTLIHDGNNIYRCLNGDSKLSTAGTGDVLAGLISSFIAQGINSIESCKLAVAIHGISGDKFKYSRGLTASELIDLVRDTMN
tara:strand:+ start:1526 stop:2323 length:798 start_codon:yes stop_codon:yes gene_type:complete